jgi:hypothetical protein
MNHIQVIGSHISFHLLPPPTLALSVDAAN